MKYSVWEFHILGLNRVTCTNGRIYKYCMFLFTAISYKNIINMFLELNIFATVFGPIPIPLSIPYKDTILTTAPDQTGRRRQISGLSKIYEHVYMSLFDAGFSEKLT